MSFDLLLIMSKELMISMLKSGKNGEQILAILDSITAQDESSEYNEPTLDSIKF
jgi:hypothetical protein